MFDYIINKFLYLPIMTIEFAQIFRMVVMRKEIKRGCFLSFISTLGMQLMNVDISHISFSLNCAET